MMVAEMIIILTTKNNCDIKQLLIYDAMQKLIVLQKYVEVKKKVQECDASKAQ